MLSLLSSDSSLLSLLFLFLIPCLFITSYIGFPVFLLKLIGLIKIKAARDNEKRYSSRFLIILLVLVVVICFSTLLTKIFKLVIKNLQPSNKIWHAFSQLAIT